MLNYDGDLQMVVEEPTSLNYDVLRFYNWLAIQGKLAEDMHPLDTERLQWDNYLSNLGGLPLCVSPTPMSDWLNEHE
jgi:hypothetical protein